MYVTELNQVKKNLRSKNKSQNKTIDQFNKNLHGFIKDNKGYEQNKIPEIRDNFPIHWYIQRDALNEIFHM